MKTLLLTGIANEVSFTEGGISVYYLVFNEGELRLPVTEDVAEYAVAAMMSEEEAEQQYVEESSSAPVEEVVAEVPVTSDYPVEAEHFSMTDYRPEDDYGVPPDGNYEDVEDGVGQL